MTIYHYQIRDQFKSFLSRWNWELHATLTFSDNEHVTLTNAAHHVKRWLGKIRRNIKQSKFAAVIVISSPNRDIPHVHCLIVSDPRFRNSLLELSINVYESLWLETRKKLYDPQFTISMCNQWDQKTITRYVTRSKNITLWDADRWDIHIYRPNLLKQLEHI